MKFLPMTTIIVFAAVAITVLIAFLLHRNVISKKVGELNFQLGQQSITIGQLTLENKKLDDDRYSLLERAAKAEAANDAVRKEIVAYEQLKNEYTELVRQSAEYSAALAAKEVLLKTQKEDLQRIGENFQSEFKNLAQNIFEEKTKRFTEVNEEKMKAILDPLKSELGHFKQKVEETYDKESKERFSLGKEVERLINMTQAVSQEANNLTNALKGNSKMQGNWGEMILESLLENSGLTKGRE